MLGKYYYFFDVDGEFNWLIQAAASTECRLFSDIPEKNVLQSQIILLQMTCCALTDWEI